MIMLFQNLFILWLFEQWLITLCEGQAHCIFLSTNLHCWCVLDRLNVLTKHISRVLLLMGLTASDVQLITQERLIVIIVKYVLSHLPLRLFHSLLCRNCFMLSELLTWLEIISFRWVVKCFIFFDLVQRRVDTVDQITLADFVYIAYCILIKFNFQLAQHVFDLGDGDVLLAG